MQCNRYEVELILYYLVLTLINQEIKCTDDAHNSGDRAKKYLFHFFGLQVNYSIYEFGDHRSCLKIVSPSHVKAKFSHKNQNRHSRGPSKLTYFLNL